MDEHRPSVAEETHAGTRAWLGLGLLVVPSMLISINSNLLNLALPAIAAELRPTGAQLLWISDIYVFLVAGLLLPMGVLADRFGRRRMLLIGAIIFGSASVAAAFAPTAPALIAARGLIGVGAAMIAPSTISLIRSMFLDAKQRAAALGIWTASFALGGIVGPVIGGVLLDTVSWRAVFMVTPPAMLVLVAIGPFVLPEHRSGARRRVDVIGVVLAMAGLLGLVSAVKQLSTGPATIAPVVTGIVGVALLAGFVVRLHRVDDPVLDLALLRTRAFSVPQLGNALAFAVLYGTQLLIGQYLQGVLGMTALEAGLWTIPSAAAYAVGGLLAARMGSRLGLNRTLGVSLAVSGVGFAVVGAVDVDAGIVAFVVGSVISSLALAPLYQATTASALGAATVDRAGVAGATLETTTNLGGALGIAVFGSIASAAYRLGTTQSGLTTESIGDIVATTSSLPMSQARALIDTAQSAFVDGLRLVVLTGAALLLLAAFLIPRLLRGR